MLDKLPCTRAARRRTCVWDRSRVFGPALLSCLNPHVSPRVGIIPAFLAGIPAPHANAESTLRGLGSTACCMPHAPLRPTYSSATGRVQPSRCSLVARTLFVRPALENAAANCVRVPLNHAALAPCCKTHGYRGRAGVIAVERCLRCRPRRELVTVAFWGRSRTVVLYTRPTQAIRASFTP